MEKNNELTGVELQRILNQRFNEQFSVSKVKDLRRKLGWVGNRTRYFQLVREVNREKRLEFESRCIETNDQFDNVIWPDECNVQLDWNGTVTFHQWWKPAPLKGKPKHPFKVSVWAAISKRGASPILTFTGIMESQYYGYSSSFSQHTSNLGKQKMEESDIVWWKAQI